MNKLNSGKAGKKKHRLPIIDIPELTWGDAKRRKSSRDYGRSLDIGLDSYILAFVGPRGAGKTLTMTAFAIKAMVQGKRVISNYDISFRLAIPKGGYRTYKSEKLDLYQLLLFDETFQNAVICIDEAPLFISHLTSMSWKNRLLDIFVQQIRKNRNSLFYASQNEGWVDNQLRWQTDAIFYCQDASRRYNWSGSLPGKGRGHLVLLKAIDKSGQWTGIPYDEKPTWYGFQLRGKKLFECYNSYEQFDVFESLKRVDMRLSSYQVGPGHQKETDNSHLVKAEATLNSLAGAGVSKVPMVDFYQSLGDINSKQKDDVAKHLTKLGVTRKRQSGGQYVYVLPV